jgi:N6-adenosine-specific RNA methylase IME4
MDRAQDQAEGGMSYGAILCDPPWAFKTYSGTHTTPHRGVQDHYATMTVSGLKSIPVRDWAAKNCALFMWVVDSHLPGGIGLATAWGFEFKTIAFVWDKSKIGMGYWTRKQSEVCLLFTCGKPSRLSKGVRQIIRAPRREHSRKPDEIYSSIESLVCGPYLEMFARQQWPGWDSWGDETTRFARAA